MKKICFTYCIFLAILLISCNNNSNTQSDTLPQVLTTISNDINNSLDTLYSDLSIACDSIANHAADTSYIRNILQNLYSKTFFLNEFAFVNMNGILQLIEPQQFYKFQGTDISAQDHIVEMYTTKQTILSKQFFAVEGFYSTVLVHPIMKGQNMYGGVTSLFFPDALFKSYVLPLVKNQTFEIWVMEKGGCVLYDQDSSEIGRNVMTDPLYQAYPDLIRAAYLIDSVQSGKTSYQFYQTGTSTVVKKLTYWTTLNLWGSQWKIVWVKPE